MFSHKKFSKRAGFPIFGGLVLFILWVGIIQNKNITNFFMNVDDGFRQTLTGDEPVQTNAENGKQKTPPDPKTTKTEKKATASGIDLKSLTIETDAGTPLAIGSHGGWITDGNQRSPATIIVQKADWGWLGAKGGN